MIKTFNVKTQNNGILKNPVIFFKKSIDKPNFL